MKREAVYPGSFDPITYGHLDLIERGSRLFDRLVVAIATNPSKSPLLTIEERCDLIAAHVRDKANVEVDSFSGLVVDFVKRRQHRFILRGLRTVSDFEFEFQMALMNRYLAKEQIDTVFMMPHERFSYTSSSLIKDIVANGGDVSNFVPPDVEKILRRRLGGA